MNGAHSGPDASELGPNGEDLNSIMGRFQDWTKTRRDKPTAKYGATTGFGRGVASDKAKLAGEARELTYEQALRASSHRRPAYPAAIETSPAEFKVQTTKHQTEEKGQPSNQAGNDARPAAKPARVPQRSVSGPNLKPTTELVAPIVRSARTAPDRSTLPNLSRVSHPSTQRTAAENPSLIRPKSFRTSTSTQKEQRIQPAFREVLTGTAMLAATPKSGAALESKSTALSLRVSDTEQARIQACAVRANLSVSAYLRQCALGVDDLRGQVELALGELQKQEARVTAQPGFSAIPGILGRFAMRCFRRLRGQTDYTAISLR
jgi:hypothetical protein